MKTQTALLLATIILSSHSVFAAPSSNIKGGELDNEHSVINQQAMRDLPAVVVIRVNQETKAVEVANLEKPIKKTDVAPGLEKSAKFTAIKEGQTYAANELDRDNSRASWRFSYYGWNGWGAGFGFGLGWGLASYYYGSYAYSYTPINYYNWGGYNYYYYGAYFNPYFGWI